MARPGRIVSAALTALLALFVIVAVATAREPTEARLESLADKVRCPQCDVAIADSQAQIALDMKALMVERVGAGWSDSQIIDAFVAAYGPEVLLDPPLSARTAALWIVPATVLVVGASLAVGRRRTAPHASAAAAQVDLADLELQVASGEIEPKRAALLRQTYLAEAEAPPPVVLSPPRTAKSGWLWGGGAVLAATLLAVQLVGSSSPEVPSAGADPSAYSNETLEAVIATNLDNALINGMRLALANRYFDTREYGKALPHYQAVLENEPTIDEQAEALAKTGWMVFDGNGEVELATGLLDRALDLRPDFALAGYFKAQVLWCGASRTEEAVDLFDQVLSNPGLPEEARSDVESARKAAAAGQGCT